MTEHKFTDEEIIKALEGKAEAHCAVCEIKGIVPCEHCVFCYVKNALDIINRQKEEIERMKARKICSIGDKLYIIVPDETAPGGYDIEINHVTDVGERFIFFSGHMPPREDVLENVAIEDIGKDVFLDEDAFRRELERRRSL